MDNRPIGVFDSGVGGLTAMKELMALLPHENIIYFGDTGRVPYGSRSRETIIRYARQDIDFLLSHDVKMIVAACGTVSSTLPPAVSDALPVPYMGVVSAAVQTACALSLGGRIGVIGTRATIRNNAYGRAIRGVRPEARVFGRACPLFVHLVENGHFSKEDPIARAAAEYYLAPLLEEKIDTLILGCTHYPLLYELVSSFFDYQVTLVDPGRETAHAVQSYLTVHDLLSGRTEPGDYRYYMTDSAEDFCEVASVFLSCDIRAQAQQVAVS
ncbi:MAG: glutamate racemase [Provencibacterium sp.]|jgi:glutamate racemase|nr:glutamate racemase [Provencibacterium sp.]